MHHAAVISNISGSTRRDASGLPMGEAGAFPNLTRIFTIWLPHSERERAQANLWLAARWGGAFTPLLVTYVLDYMIDRCDKALATIRDFKPCLNPKLN